MQRIARSSPLLVVVFVFALGLPQFAFAQRLKPIPHPIGVMQHPATAAATQTAPEARAQVSRCRFHCVGVGLALDAAQEPAGFLA